MQRFFAFLLVIGLICLIFVSALGAEKLSPYLRLLLAADPKIAPAALPGFGGTPPGFTLPFPTNEPIRVLVKLSHPFFGTSLLGFPVIVSTGTIVGLRVPVEGLLTLAAASDVVYVEPAWKAKPTLDRSVPAIGADVLHASSPPVTGKGVIIGGVDTGIDYSHYDFRYDSDGDGIEESSRILYILDQTGLFNATYTKAEIESDLRDGLGPNEGDVREQDTDGHGTHVMGIAAGDGSASTAGFIGVAPQAWIIAVKTTFYTSDILAGVRYIFDKADELGLPVVVNLSLGGQDGPHDGTSLFEQGLDELLDRPGRAIVVSAGNEGDKAIHVGRSLNGDAYTFSLVPREGSLDFSLWYPGGSSFTITVVPPGGAPISVPTGGSDSASTPSGNVYVDNASGGENPENGDNEALINLSGLTSQLPWSVTVTDSGGGGRFDGWITSDNGTILGGDASETVDEPGNARRVITVGAFTTKNRWASRAGEEDFSDQYPIGDLSYFSSRGPTRDGRVKPEITAPGAWIAAAMSSSAPAADYLTCPDGVHTLLLGTSMAAPHVTGTIALMFSIDPDLTATEVRDILTGTAQPDGFTGAVPNPEWGWGKLRADTAVSSLSPPPPGPTASLKVKLAENPVRTSARFICTVPDDSSGATLYIYDVAGRSVAAILIPPGGSNYDWDLTDASGMPLAPGLYLFVLSDGTACTSIGKLVIER